MLAHIMGELKILLTLLTEILLTSWRVKNFGAQGLKCYSFCQLLCGKCSTDSEGGKTYVDFIVIVNSIVALSWGLDYCYLKIDTFFYYYFAYYQ